MSKNMKPRCSGKTKAGKPCKASPLKGTDRCRRHPLAGDTQDAHRARPERWDRRGWLVCFEWAGTVTAACELLGVSRNTVYEERQRNEDFAVAWADVEERVVESMEREAYRRAVEGVVEPMVSAGKHVADVRRFSDGLLQFLLKARRPEKYRENVKVEHAGAIRQDVRVDLSKVDDDELETLERILDKAAA